MARSYSRVCNSFQQYAPCSLQHAHSLPCNPRRPEHSSLTGSYAHAYLILAGAAVLAASVATASMPR
ncbi:hypothetical protein EEB14_50960 [Rhodococcus sp. WS4]|nr:hypothetical protein EEB14_50960 [Rhodococcus sp. WS4]